MHLVKLRQKFDATELADPVAVLREQLDQLDSLIHPGTRVAIAVGSRGISNLAAIVKGVCEYVSRRGASPFVVPAMGSHGGATAEGQREILRLYGICEETIGVPVRASMAWTMFALGFGFFWWVGRAASLSRFSRTANR